MEELWQVLKKKNMQRKKKVYVKGDVRGNVMKWEILNDEDEEIRLDHVSTLGDAVRGLHIDSWSLTAVGYDGSCTIWNFWD